LLDINSSESKNSEVVAAWHELVLQPGTVRANGHWNRGALADIALPQLAALVTNVRKTRGVK